MTKVLILDTAFAANFVDIMTRRSIPFAMGSLGSHVLSDMFIKINLVVKPEKTPTLTPTPHSPLLLKTVHSNGNGATATKPSSEEPPDLEKPISGRSNPIDGSPDDSFLQV